MTISIVITTYNDGEYLSDCLASVMNQSHPPSEVLIVDDGSTRLASIMGLEGALRQFPEARLIRQENGGPSAARNTGLAACAGEYVAFVDADDRLRLDNLELKRRLIGQRADIVGSFGGFVMQGLRSGRSQFRDYLGPIEADLVGHPQGIPGGLHQYLLRRDALMATGGLDSSLTIMEDFDLLIRLGRLGGLIAGCNEPIYVRTVRNSSLSRGSTRRRIAGSRAFLRKAKRERYFSRRELMRRQFHMLADGGLSSLSLLLGIIRARPPSPPPINE